MNIVMSAPKNSKYPDSSLFLCALTGAANDISPRDLAQISEQYPWVEWGLLISYQRAGKGRYPSPDWVFECLALSEETGAMKCALHLCDQAVKDFVFEPQSGIRAASALANRVQLNFRYRHDGPVQSEALNAAIESHSGMVITPQNESNSMINAQIRCENHAILNDESCGRGLLPNAWQNLMPKKIGGYAGGITAANVAGQLDAIASAHSNTPFWIDMETSLRTADDRFSLETCLQVLENVDRWIVSSNPFAKATNAEARAILSNSELKAAMAPAQR